MKMREEASDLDQVKEGFGFPLMQTCNRHGVYLSFLGASGTYTGCSQCSGSEASLTSFSIDERMSLGVSRTAGIPESLLDASFSSFRPTSTWHAVMLSYVQGITKQWEESRVDECGQLVFLGERNSGKSHIALSVLRSLSIENSVLYIDARRGAADVPADCYLLVVDNLFCRDKPTPRDVRDHWNNVLYTRAARQLPTIIVSDQDTPGFRSYLNRRSLRWMRLSKTKVVNFQL